jgi:hypothetical protein
VHRAVQSLRQVVSPVPLSSRSSRSCDDRGCSVLGVLYARSGGGLMLTGRGTVCGLDPRALSLHLDSTRIVVQIRDSVSVYGPTPVFRADFQCAVPVVGLSILSIMIIVSSALVLMALHSMRCLSHGITFEGKSFTNWPCIRRSRLPALLISINNLSRVSAIGVQLCWFRNRDEVRPPAAGRTHLAQRLHADQVPPAF